MYVRPASGILSVGGMLHEVKIIPANKSPIHDLKTSAMVKTLKFSCMYDTSSSKLRREVMKHTLDGRNSVTKPHSSLLCLLHQSQAQLATDFSLNSSMAPITKRTEKVTSALGQYRYIAPPDETGC